MKFTKLALALPLVAISANANAEIVIDAQNNVFYTGAKESALVISADGTVGVNGTVLHKCDGTESNKTTKAKLGTVTCDADYIKLRDKNGNELARYSGYARATDGKSEERKLFDGNVAAIGSATTGAASTSVTEEVVTETVKEKTVVSTPAAALVPEPAAPKVDERLYTPKLGTAAQQTPAITKKNTINQSKADAEVRAAEKQAKAYDEQRKKAGDEVIVTTTEQVPTEAVEKTTTTTIQQPVPGAGQQLKTDVTTTETKVPVETKP